MREDFVRDLSVRIDVIFCNLCGETRENHEKLQPVFSNHSNREIQEYEPRILLEFVFRTLLLPAELCSPLVFMSDTDYVTYILLA
jgi:hypothetical protein